MKKALLIIVVTILSLCTASLYSAEPVVKFYLQDGSSKIYNIKDIDNIIFSKNQQSLIGWEFSGHRFYNFTTSSIDSINFGIGLNDNPLIRLNFNYNWQIACYLSSIDSIIVKDISQSVKIGTLEWSSKNLDVDHYRNGDSIPEVRDSVTWSKLTTGAWCYYNNDSALGKIYGKLYNWYAVNDPRGLAPEGWHVASEEEWKLLTTFLGGDSVAGNKLIEYGQEHWISNGSASNETGFTALPGGYRGLFSKYKNIRGESFFWSSSDLRKWEAIMIYFSGNYFPFTIWSCDKAYGLSVRCIKN